MANNDSLLNPINEKEQTITISQLLEIFQNFNYKTAIKAASNSNYQNYTKWAKLMYLGINNRGRLNHIIASPPVSHDPVYQKRTQQDSSIVSWSLVNIDPNLANQFRDYFTVKDLQNRLESYIVVAEMASKFLTLQFELTA